MTERHVSSRVRRTLALGGATLLAAGLSVGLLAGSSQAGTSHIRLPSHSATTVCDQLHAPYGGSLTGAYATTVGEMVAWDQSRPNGGDANAGYANLPTGDPLDVCFFAGTFTGFPGPPGAPISYGTVVVVVLPDKSSVLDFAGPSNLEFNPPPSPSG